MKKTILVSALLALSAAASAQTVTILPGGAGNLFVGQPVTLPSPFSIPTINPRIGLPGPVLTPALTVALNPTPMTSAAIVAVPLLSKNMPTAIPVLHKTLPGAVAPALGGMKLSAASTGDKAKTDEARRKLDEQFDGRQSVEKSSVDTRPTRREPATSGGRHISLPERDLESEIGAY